MCMLQTQAPAIIFSHRFRFDAFSTDRTNTICMRIRFHPLSRAFSNQRVFSENAELISGEETNKEYIICESL